MFWFGISWFSGIVCGVLGSVLRNSLELSVSVSIVMFIYTDNIKRLGEGGGRWRDLEQICFMPGSLEWENLHSLVVLASMIIYHKASKTKKPNTQFWGDFQTFPKCMA